MIKYVDLQRLLPYKLLFLYLSFMFVKKRSVVGDLQWLWRDIVVMALTDNVVSIAGGVVNLPNFHLNCHNHLINVQHM